MSRWRRSGRELEVAELDPSAELPEQPRLAVAKSFKLFIGGAFVRSESGRSVPVELRDGERRWAPAASRKDVRDAVLAARGAWSGWAARSAFNRGQILYRIAEVAEDRRPALVAELAEQGVAEPEREVEVAIERFVHYAGWSDKLAQVSGSVNPVAGDYFDFTMPEPTGVVAILAPPASPLAGLASRLGPALAAGNATVAVASPRAPLSALTLGEVMATADVPAGVVNLLSGRAEELLAPLAGHMDVNAIDLCDLSGELLVEAERAAASNLKRVVRRSGVDWLGPEAQGLEELLGFVEMKTVWHSMGY